MIELSCSRDYSSCSVLYLWKVLELLLANVNQGLCSSGGSRSWVL